MKSMKPSTAAALALTTLVALSGLLLAGCPAQEAESAQLGSPGSGPELTADVEMIGDRPTGEIAADVPLVQRGIAVTRALGLEPSLTRSSTDSNVPISMGIPAFTIGGGGDGGGSHSLDEWYRNADGPRGIQRALLIVLAQAGLADAG